MQVIWKLIIESSFLDVLRILFAHFIFWPHVWNQWANRFLQELINKVLITDWLIKVLYKIFQNFHPDTDFTRANTGVYHDSHVWNQGQE